MADVTATISTAIRLVTRLGEINETIKQAEFANLLAELSLELSHAKAEIAGLIDENTTLKQRINTVEDGEPCPACRKRAWRVTSSKPHPTFGELGGIQRTYTCGACGFTEDKLIQ